MCKFCDANSKGEILSGKPVRTFEWQKTAGYKAPEKRNDFLEMFILKLKNDKKAGLMVDNGYGCRYVDIDYCMFCRKEARRVKTEQEINKEIQKHKEAIQNKIGEKTQDDKIHLWIIQTLEWVLK